jgi:hypothetical protein
VITIQRTSCLQGRCEIHSLEIVFIIIIFVKWSNWKGESSHKSSMSDTDKFTTRDLTEKNRDFAPNLRLMFGG